MQTQSLYDLSPLWRVMLTGAALAALPMRDIQVIAEVSDLDVFADPLFERVFYNLIDNSLRHGETVSEIRFFCQHRGEDLYIVYEDNGIGIDPQHHQEIFDIFKRLHTTDQYSGSGVGLAIVKAAVEDQGGGVRVESRLGQGTKFIFTIPKNLTPARPLY